MRSRGDEHGPEGRAVEAPSAARAGPEPFSDREVAIVPRGEPSRPDGVWTRFEVAIAARRRLGAPPGMTERIMGAIRRASSS